MKFFCVYRFQDKSFTKFRYNLKGKYSYFIFGKVLVILPTCRERYHLPTNKGITQQKKIAMFTNIIRAFCVRLFPGPFRKFYVILSAVDSMVFFSSNIYNLKIEAKFCNNPDTSLKNIIRKLTFYPTMQTTTLIPHQVPHHTLTWD